MLRIYKFKKIWILVFCLGWMHAMHGQEVYQASVMKGVYLEGFGGIHLLNNKLLSTATATGLIFGIGAGYGLNESLFTYFRFQASMPSKLKEREIGFLLYTRENKSQNTSFGIGYALGRPVKKFRPAIFAGATYTTGTVSVFDDGNDNLFRVNLKGLGFEAGIRALYFLQPFLSVDAAIIYKAGKYDQSEFLGRTYRENIKWSAPQAQLGLTYHFKGR